MLLSSLSYAKRPELSYTYLSIGGNNGDRQLEVSSSNGLLSNTDVKFRGFFLNGSKSIADNFYLAGSASSHESDKFYPFEGSLEVRKFNVDYYRLQLGLGFNVDIMRNQHGIFQINYEQEAYSISDKLIEDQNLISTNTESGFSIKAGLRSLFADFIETGLYLEHIDTSQTNTGAIVEARVNIMQKASMGLTGTFNDNTLYSLDFRANF